MPDLDDPTYVAGLAIALNLATQFRIPCPGHPYGPNADLFVKKRTDGEPGWAITDGMDTGESAWTGTDWVYRGALSRDAIYPYTREQAIAEAQRIAPRQTSHFMAVVGPIQLGQRAPAGGQWGIRAWMGCLLVIGHEDLRHTRRRLQHLYPHLRIPPGNHDHAHLDNLYPPWMSKDNNDGGDYRGWVIHLDRSDADNPAALPITIFVPSRRKQP